MISTTVYCPQSPFFLEWIEMSKKVGRFNCPREVPKHSSPS